jgi:phosphoglycolate phosphatase-like HAD superfamily hydrolase
MLVLFDYDGVIVDSFAPLLDLCVQAQLSLGRGRPPTAHDFQTIENLDFVSLAKLLGLPDEMCPQYAELVYTLQREAWSVHAFPAIPDVFRALAKEHTLGVITASQGPAVADTLTDFGLDGAVKMVLGGELGKSKAARIDQARSTYGTAAAETLMVGDAISDIRQGKLAGVGTVAVAWGFQNRDLLARETPDFLIDRPEQLLEVVSGEGIITSLEAPITAGDNQ